MLPHWVSNPGPLTYESGALPIALCGPAPGDATRHIIAVSLKGTCTVCKLDLVTATANIQEQCNH